MDNVYIQLVLTLGFPSACLMAVGVAVWRILVWVGANVVKPATAKHIEFLDSVQESIGKIADALELHQIAYQRDQEVWKTRWEKLEERLKGVTKIDAGP